MHRRILVSILLLVMLSACKPSPSRPHAGLTLEEHPLSQPPASDEFGFQPVNGTQAEVLARNAAERSQTNPVTVAIVDGNPALTASGGGGEFIAVLLTDETNPPAQIVEVSQNGQVIFTTPAGMPSPILPLQGLWIYGDYWALEIVFASPDVWAGQVFIDGELVNQSGGYDEAFGFQLLAGKPFFFYYRDGQAGLSYDGVEADLPYDNIPHYLCCSESVLNPVQAANMTAFFAQRGSDWYYVELGNFSRP
jgi:hypothetical protein